MISNQPIYMRYMPREEGYTTDKRDQFDTVEEEHAILTNSHFYNGWLC